MKNLIRDTLYKSKFIKNLYRRHILPGAIAIACYAYDFRVGWTQLRWVGEKNRYWKLSTQLIFQYHKLEKALCLPGPKRFFGRDPAFETCRLMREWVATGLPTDHPVYVGALEAVRAYRVRLDVTPPPEDIRAALLRAVDGIIGETPVAADSVTPMLPQLPPEGAFEALSELAIARRSVRTFSPEPVDFALIEKAVALAQLAPSACNRQSWRIHFYDKKDDITRMLALQNGNNGFGHTIPLLVVISADMNSFFDASERIEPALDSGLFLMAFLLALQSLGLSSCCLNWCVTPGSDKRAHRIGNIPESHQISTFLAVGHAAEQSLVPRSARRPLADVIIRH